MAFVLPFIVGIGFIVFFIFFPHIFNKQWLVNVQYLENDHKPRVVTIYQEIGSSEDDGSFLTGYWVYFGDPVSNKELSKIFIKRKARDIPPVPQMICTSKNEIWIIEQKGIYQGDTGAVILIKNENDQLKRIPTPFLKGWIVNGASAGNVLLVNQYNETGCLNILTHEVLVPGCPYIEDSIAVKKNCFFLIKNTMSSTRSHLYYYETTESFPPPGVFAGMVEEGKPVPGWHLMDLLAMQRGAVLKSDLDVYRSAFTGSEKVTPIYEKELLNNPVILYDEKGICILSASDDINKGCTFFEFNSTGKLIWKVECPKLRKRTAAYGFSCIYKPDETLIIHPENWVISIDNNAGKINWQYPR